MLCQPWILSYDGSRAVLVRQGLTTSLPCRSLNLSWNSLFLSLRCDLSSVVPVVGLTEVFTFQEFGLCLVWPPYSSLHKRFNWLAVSGILIEIQVQPMLSGILVWALVWQVTSSDYGLWMGGDRCP